MKITEKKCCTCDEVKPLPQFYTNIKRSDGYHTECKVCSKSRSLKWQNANRDKMRVKGNALRRKKIDRKDARFYLYNKLASSIQSARIRGYAACDISLEELIKRYTNRCQICRVKTKDFSICLDHCHKTGKFRGFLCNLCNQGIGLLKDDIKILRSCIAYLDRTM